MSRNRKPKPMKWDVFVNRRGIDVATWLTHNSISNMATLEAWCLANNVEMPSKSVFVKTVRVAPPKIKVDAAVPIVTAPILKKPRELKTTKQVELVTPVDKAELHVEQQEAEITTSTITSSEPTETTLQTD